MGGWGSCLDVVGAGGGFFWVGWGGMRGWLGGRGAGGFGSGLEGRVGVAVKRLLRLGGGGVPMWRCGGGGDCIGSGHG